MVGMQLPLYTCSSHAWRKLTKYTCNELCQHAAELRGKMRDPQLAYEGMPNCRAKEAGDQQNMIDCLFFLITQQPAILRLRGAQIRTALLSTR
jgi:hypothetical protein